MSELFRAQVAEVSEKSVRISLRVVSAEVQRLWTSKTFALSLLLEPIVLGSCEPSATLAAALPRDRIVAVDLAALLASDAAPIATYRIGVKKEMASHLSRGLSWPSAACDIP